MLIGKVVYGYLKRHPCLPSENLLLTPGIRVRPWLAEHGREEEDIGMKMPGKAGSKRETEVFLFNTQCFGNVETYTRCRVG